MIEKKVGVSDDPKSDVIEKKASDGPQDSGDNVDVPQEPKPQIYDGELEKFKGKSVEDIAKSYRELEKLQSQQASKLGEIEKERDAYRQMIEMAQRQAQMGQPAPHQPQPPDTSYDDKFYESPTQASRTLVQEELRKYQQATQVQNAYRMAPFVKNQAKQMWPGAFKDVDDNAIQNILMRGVSEGRIHPNFIETPEGWAMAAWQYKGQQMGFSVPQSPNPTMPDGTNLPPATKQGVSQADPSLPKEAEELLRVWGANDSETKKQVAKDLEDYRKDMYGGDR